MSGASFKKTVFTEPPSRQDYEGVCQRHEWEGMPDAMELSPDEAIGQNPSWEMLSLGTYMEPNGRVHTVPGTKFMKPGKYTVIVIYEPHREGTTT